MTDRELLEITLELIEGHCIYWWAYDGPDVRPVDMKTCAICRAIYNIKKHLAT